MRNGIRVSHMLAALEQSDADNFIVWLGESAETPVPINTKEELIDVLGLTLDEIIEIGVN